MKDNITIIIGIALLIGLIGGIGLYAGYMTLENRVEIHRMWTDALVQSVETICDRFLIEKTDAVLDIDGENYVVEVQR